MAYPTNNSQVFNVFLPIETALLLSAAQLYFNSKKSKHVLLVSYLIFLMIYAMDILWIGNIRNFAIHAATIEGILLMLVSIVMLYTHFMHRSGGLSSPIVFAGTGMVFYFASTIPYFCVMFYFQRQNSDQNKYLFNYIVVTAAFIRYLFLALTFLVAARKHMNKETQLIGHD